MKDGLGALKPTRCGCTCGLVLPFCPCHCGHCDVHQAVLGEPALGKNSFVNKSLLTPSNKDITASSITLGSGLCGKP